MLKYLKYKFLTAINFVWISFVSLGCLIEAIIGGIIIGIIIAPIIVIYQHITGTGPKKCIHCREYIKHDATKCPKCGGWQNQDEEQ